MPEGERDSDKTEGVAVEAKALGRVFIEHCDLQQTLRFAVTGKNPSGHIGQEGCVWLEKVTNLAYCCGGFWAGWSVVG